jgi:hypothetical protein
VNDGIIVRYCGFHAKRLAREYSFQECEASAEREFTLSVANDAFLSHLARYQDGPDICAQRLQAELTAHANRPSEMQCVITSAELDSYRASRAVKPSRYPARDSET